MKTKISEQIKPSEAAKSLVFPITLTPAKKILASKQLEEARRNLRNKATDKEILAAKLLQLKFQLEDYLNDGEFDEDLKFGDFLKLYLQILNKKRNEFAHEISVHETLVSQLINNNRTPSENIIIRLELHSNQNIPAHYWFGLVEKEKIHEIKTNKNLRVAEKNKVYNKVLVKI